MIESTSPSWMFEAALFVGVFSAMTWGFLTLLKPRLYQPDATDDQADPEDR